jgi:hypothetical protein
MVKKHYSPFLTQNSVTSLNGTQHNETYQNKAQHKGLGTVTLSVFGLNATFSIKIPSMKAFSTISINKTLHNDTSITPFRWMRVKHNGNQNPSNVINGLNYNSHYDLNSVWGYLHDTAKLNGIQWTPQYKQHSA